MGCAQSSRLHLKGPGCLKQRWGVRRSRKGSLRCRWSVRKANQPHPPPFCPSPVPAKKPNSTLTQLGNGGGFPFQRKPKVERENSIAVGHRAAPLGAGVRIVPKPCCSELTPGLLRATRAPQEVTGEAQKRSALGDCAVSPARSSRAGPQSSRPIPGTSRAHPGHIPGALGNASITGTGGHGEPRSALPAASSSSLAAPHGFSGASQSLCLSSSDPSAVPQRQNDICSANTPPPPRGLLSPPPPSTELFSIKQQLLKHTLKVVVGLFFFYDNLPL